ncbi:GNAT family N-acetyltransferase [Marinivivus vitaminiproducens]|uniref:GNAT family N-acetyltransferase n=1 Tax=Marinivivus vitaminiproducens TaxID=3035935 RepID=UPI0027A79293|nr:GNAT family N-acetyltransferase [Geminicoccaceae bacterium SCSIO 64248]
MSIAIRETPIEPVPVDAAATPVSVQERSVTIPVTEAGLAQANALFQQDWWLNAASPGGWDAVTVEQGGACVARLAFAVRRHAGITALTQPPLTPFLGPWLRMAEGKANTRLAREHELLGKLADALPPYDVFAQDFHPQYANWLPFHWRGFRQTTRYTYVIDDLDDLDQTWAGLHESTRREVRKARKCVTVDPGDDLETFIELNRMTYRRQGRSLPYDPAILRRVDTACARQGARRVLIARDGTGRAHAGLYLVWDQSSAYYLMGGLDPERRSSGAMSLLMWQAIRLAATVTRSFNFEGSMIQPIERFFRGFGARQVPYSHIRTSRTLKGRIAEAGHELLRSTWKRNP